MNREPGQRAPQRTVSCPRCGKLVVWDGANRYRPFCSERCKLIDLGQWAEERYRIPDETPKDPPPDSHG